MLEKIIEELKKEEEFKDIDVEQIVTEIIKEGIKGTNDINKGKAEIHIKKDGFSVTTEMHGNTIILVALLCDALREVQEKNNISDEEVKKIKECSHSFAKEEM